MTIDTRISIALFKGTAAFETKYTDTQVEVNFDEIPNIVTQKLWSPFKFRGDQKTERSKNNFVSCQILVLDIDDGIRIEDAIAELEARNLTFIIGTTKSHQKEKNGKVCDRFRVILPLNTEITSEAEYLATWHKAKSIFPQIDNSCKDVARFYFPCSAIVKIHPGTSFEKELDLKKCQKQSALNATSSDVQAQGVGVGGRNAYLTKFGGVLRNKGLAFEAIYSALLGINDVECTPPLDQREVYSIAKSVSNYSPGHSTPIKHFTDAENAELFMAKNSNIVFYIHPWKSWYIYDGCRWKRDEQEKINQIAKATIRSIYDTLSYIDDDQKKKDFFKHAIRSENEKRLQSMVKLAKSELAMSHDSLDKDQCKINLKNGTFNLLTGKLEPHSPSDLITEFVDIIYDPNATCPTWISFLDKITGSNRNLIAFLKRAIGYCLSGLTSEQCLFILYGSGSNGKSVFIELIRQLLGSYARQADFNTFILKDGEKVRNDLARLVGARMVAAVESPENKFLDEATVKQLTGSDTVTARFLHQEYFEFRPSFKIWLATNHKPRIKGTDNGIWRRLHLIPFSVTIQKEDQDRSLPDKLRKELSGILNWALEGFYEWQKIGLSVPDEVLNATNEYREDQDHFGAFLKDRCFIGPSEKATISELKISYENFCKSLGEMPRSSRSLIRYLKEKGFAEARTSSERYLTGLSCVPIT